MEEEKRRRRPSVSHDRSSKRSRRGTHSSRSEKRERNRSRSSDRASKRYKRDKHDKSNKNDIPQTQENKSVFEENWDKDDQNNKNDAPRTQEVKSVFEENWDKDDKNNKNDIPHKQENKSIFDENWDNENENKREEESRKCKKQLNPITSRTGGAYIPPAKLKMMQAHIRDKSSAEYQRIAWEALKKSIHGLINKVNKSNIAEIIKQLLKENIVRGRGLLCKSIIQAQALSLTFTNVYAALVALINSRFPNIGELLLRRLVLQFKRGFRRNNKTMCVASTTFIAHLVNQRVAHEILALEILTLLVETPTAHSIEIAISFLKECGMRLTEVSRKGIEAIFQMLRNILHEGKLDKRVDYMVEVIFQIRRNNFKDHEAIIESLDLVEEEDQFTHIITLEDATDGDDNLNAFKFDPQYLENEEKYKDLSKEMLGESGESNSESGSSSESEEEEDSNEENEDEEDKKQLIIDRTETNLVSLRRTIYLTIYSSLDYEECAHKLMKMDLKPGQEVELCNMILDCCCEMRTYEKFFGLLAQRFCLINKIYVTPFENMFKDSYDTVYRLKPNQLRNVAKFFAHLLYTDAISWEVLSCIRLNEEETTSSGRIFIKIVFQELSEHMGLSKLNERVKDVTLQSAFTGLFPRDNPKNARFAINFFTSIGLGGLTDDLREHLKGQVKAEVFEVQLAAPDNSSDSSSEDSSSSSTSSESESSDSSEHRSKKSKQKSKRKISKKGKKSYKTREERKKVEKREKKERRKTNKKKSSKSKHRDRR